MQGFIIENISNLYQIKNDNKVYEATARGKFKKDDITPVVGDFVQFEIVDEENKKAVITEIEERKVYIKRPKLANITQLIFVLSSKEPKPDLLMLDKQLAFAEFLNIKSVIILNKIDLDEEKLADRIQTLYEKIGYIVIKTDAKKGIGVDEIKKRINSL